MSNETVSQIQKQFDSTFAAPARNFVDSVVDHFEQLVNLQFGAAKAYADASVKQARAALDVKDPSDLNAYIANQQKVVQELGERMKGDAEKVVSLNQAFAQKTQKAAEENVANVSKATQESAKSTAKAAQAK
ncbi:phasin family protein [Ectothiorhodospiraceae bacterium WFHF3C12]|nr:phasin family protein [Ectothiorhodospiraceae bacterium WFHF3C12]